LEANSVTDDVKLKVKLLRKWEKDLGKIAERLPQIGPWLEPEDLDYIIECALAVANKAQRLTRATDLCGK
jgi:hypothetical protein